MQKIEFTSKEQVIYFMLTTSISLSHYDHKFISNMQSLTQDKKQITSGQAELFDKLLHKYRKQFATNGYTVDELETLTWKCVVVPSLPKYTNANVDWDDSVNKMVIRVPFKKEFISNFRKEMTTFFPIDDYGPIDNSQPWVWNSERKRYEADPSTSSLKLAYNILPEYFTTVYHNEIKDVIETLEQTKVEYKEPTLVLTNGQYTVVKSNSVLDELLAGVTLDNSAKCLYRMSQLGIKVDESVTQNDEKLLFASSYIVECDIDDINNWCEWLKELDVDEILLGRGSPQSGPLERVTGRTAGLEIFKEARTAFKEHGFAMYKSKDLLDSESAYSDEEPSSTSLPVLVQFNSIVEPEQCHGADRNGKIIIITNRRTVNIS